MPYVDTHAHIYLEPFDDDFDQVVGRARKADVEGVYMPNIDAASIERMLKAEASYPGYCFPMMGLHPCSVGENFEEELEKMEALLDEHTYYGIGETGTDLYWDKTYIEQQKESLAIQASWAKRHRLPIILHSRDSLDETIEVIEQAHTSDLRGIFHCFTGTAEQASRINELGFFLGIGGVVTFRNSNLDEVLAGISLDALVLETDSPYLSPVPHRGKRNEPANIPLIAEKIADIYHIKTTEVARITTENAAKVFRHH